MKVTCPRCSRRVTLQGRKNRVCACGELLNYRHFLHEKITYDVYLADANVLIYAFEKRSHQRRYCYTVVMLRSPSIVIATTQHIIDEVGPVIQQYLPATFLVYTVRKIPPELQEIKTNVFKQPSLSDFSLIQAACEHPEVKGIITYDRDFGRIATSGFIEKKSSVKFWLGDAQEFIEKHRIAIKRQDEHLRYDQ
ncbi:MAG: type II toxin-antitoxin system VapC family toxin [Candidatus Thermoplasmatota archaeon]